MNKQETQLLQKFLDDTIYVESELKDAYDIIISNKPLDQLFYWLQKLTDNSYDFAFLSKEAEALHSNRRDVRSLIDIFCDMIGNKIEEECDHNYHFVPPSNFEDYCPFPSEHLVLYTNRPTTQLPKHDGYTWQVINMKPEYTPYYDIKCYQIERVY